MADAFLQGISRFYYAATDSNATGFVPCESHISHYRFYQYSIIPAVVLILLLAATTSRRQRLLEFLNGRPGLLFPMDTLTRSSRISYACAYGATAFLVYQISIQHQFAVDYDGILSVETVMAILSMIIYGLVFFPLFACLALGTAFSFGLGTIYVWMFFVVDLYRLSECSFTLAGRAVLFIRMLPSLGCLGYLSVALPIRFALAIYHKNYVTTDLGERPPDETMKEIRASFQGQHVRKLLRKPDPVIEPVGLVNVIEKIIISKLQVWIYHREKGFRYPSRLLAVMFVAACVVYVLTVELTAYFFSLFGNILDVLTAELDAIGWDPVLGEDTATTLLRKGSLFAYYAARTIKYSLIIALILACTLSFFTILHMMSSFRTNLYALYRGDFSTIPAPEQMGAVSLCTGSMKFAGYQVAYFVWAFVVNFAIIAIVCFAVGALVNLFMFNITDFLKEKVLQFWPTVLIAIILMIVQMLLAKFIFLQDKGQHLRLDNRRFYFVFVYFMFFFNIFLGLVSCLLRILKAIGVGTLFLARLDNSTLPRKFEFFDPGFAAYQGFIHMEAAHTHPVVNIFIRLLATLSRQRRETDLTEPVDGIDMKTLRTDIEHGTTVTKIAVCRSSTVAARFNWLVTYTLLHNPTVRIYRRGYVHALKRARKEGKKIPISDRPITSFDLVKTEEERERERLEELMKIEGARNPLRGAFNFVMGKSAYKTREAESSLSSAHLDKGVEKTEEEKQVQTSQVHLEVKGTSKVVTV